MALNAKIIAKFTLSGALGAVPQPIPFCWGLDNFGWETGHWYSFRASLKNSFKLSGRLSTCIRFECDIGITWRLDPVFIYPDPTPVKIEDYTRLVPWQHRRPKFLALLSSIISHAVDLQNLECNLSRYFDVDGALGVQLDKIGEWVGVSRVILRVTNDDTGEIEAVQLPDHVFRSLVKAKIAANSWDGSKDGISNAWEVAFGDRSKVAVIDNLDMSMSMLILGIESDAVFREMLSQGLLPLRPSGVMVNYLIADPSDKKMFAWDSETEIFGGWDEAGWIWKVVE